jgi:hypothetical protein
LTSRRYSAIVGGLLYGFLTIWMHAVEWFAALASMALGLAILAVQGTRRDDNGAALDAAWRAAPAGPAAGLGSIHPDRILFQRSGQSRVNAPAADRPSGNEPGNPLIPSESQPLAVPSVRSAFPSFTAQWPDDLHDGVSVVSRSPSA